MDFRPELGVERTESEELSMREGIDEERLDNDLNIGSEQAWWRPLLPVAICLGLGAVFFLLSYLL